MKLYANVRARVVQNQVVHVRKKLLGPGKLKVKKNQEILPSDFLGKYTTTTGFTTINIAKRLGVSPKEAAKYISAAMGATLFKGELIAQKKGVLGKKTIFAPTDAVVDEYSDNGILRLKFLTREQPLLSGVFGIVDAVNEVTGEVIIKTVGTQIYGLVGSGQERSGILNIVARDGILTDASKIKETMTQKILVVGSLIFDTALKKAMKIGVTGIITGGINAEVYQRITGSLDPGKNLGSEIGLSLLVTEGFGPIPIGEDILKVLDENEGHFIFIEGNSGILHLPSSSMDSILTLRKISLPVQNFPSGADQISIGELSQNQRVRIIWPPFMGAQGKILQIDKTPTMIESGISTYLVTVDTASRKLKVPFTNLEIIR